jgi:hypothetical protein
MLNLRRRQFITLLGGAAAWPLAARAQQRERVPRVGVLFNLPPDDQEAQARLTALVQGLQEWGWTDRRNIRIVTPAERPPTRGTYNGGYIDCGSNLPQRVCSEHAFAKMVSGLPRPPMTSHLGGDGPTSPLVGPSPFLEAHTLFWKRKRQWKNHPFVKDALLVQQRKRGHRRGARPIISCTCDGKRTASGRNDSESVCASTRCLRASFQAW